MEDTYTVSQLNSFISGLLDTAPELKNIQIIGEVSNFKRYSSGHCYFTLKDADSVLKCVMFRFKAKNLRFEPKNGDTVIAIGSVKVYPRDGLYQLYTDLLLPQGQGNLMLAYEELKQKLSKEGLFDVSRKQALPVNPKAIGVITSPSGAVIRDIITVSRRRNKGIKIYLYPVRVQGTEASGEIVKAIEFFNREQLADTLIVGRGGGSMEDLWAFNEEPTVRAVAASKLPIISAVGHETDFTLCDFAADKRAATPSEAAEMAVPDREGLRQRVLYLQKRSQALLENKLQSVEHLTERLCSSWVFQEPERLFLDKEQRVDISHERLGQLMENILRENGHSFELQIAKLEGLSPLAVMARGYSVTRRQSGAILTSVDQLEEEGLFQELATELEDGVVYSTVSGVERKER